MFASRGALRILLLTVLAVLAGCPGDKDDQEDTSGFVQSDLAGRWRYTIFYSGPAVAAGTVPAWVRGTVSVNATGSATIETFADSGGNTTVPPVAITYALDANGVVTETTTNFPGFWGKMNGAKSFFATTATQGTGPSERSRLTFYQRIVPGAAFSASDVGPATFAFRQLATGAAPSWERGRVVVGADRVYSVLDVVDPTGPQGDAPNAGTFSISGDGVVTTTERASFAGYMSADKQLVIATQSAGSEHRVTSLVRAATGFAQSDLVGGWHFLNLSTTGWARGTVSFDGGGVATFAQSLDSEGGTALPSPFTLSVAGDGTVTQTSPAPSAFSGILTPAKDVMIATETHEAGVYGLIVAIR